MRNQVRAAWRNFLLREKGVASIEFAMVFIPFFISILFIAEMCRVTFISSAMDLVLAESGQVASISTKAVNYETYFTNEMNERLKKWPLISRDVEVELLVNYCDSITTLINNAKDCLPMDAVGKSLALYSIKIGYKPLFFIFPRKGIERELSRRIVFVQEFQRDLGESK